jgi:hypothetical protein
MGNEVVGDIARGMPHGPIERTDKDKPRKGNPILAVLGSPSFLAGDGRRYPRTTGFGSSKKPHPDGGTNETAAFVVFKPFAGLDIAVEGRIYCERFAAEGKNKRIYSVSLTALKAERRDAPGRQAIEGVKIAVRDLYRAWITSDAAKSAVSTAKVVAADRWEETDE